MNNPQQYQLTVFKNLFEREIMVKRRRGKLDTSTPEKIAEHHETFQAHADASYERGWLKTYFEVSRTYHSLRRDTNAPQVPLVLLPQEIERSKGTQEKRAELERKLKIAEKMIKENRGDQLIETPSTTERILNFALTA